MAWAGAPDMARGSTTGEGVAAEATNVTGMAGRYASALFDLAREAGSVDAVEADLGRFEAMMADSADLHRLVRSPAFTSEQQLAAITAILARAGIAGLAGNFLRLVTTNRRLFSVGDMIRDYRKLVAISRGETTAEVTVAEPLAERHEAALREALRDITGKDVKVVTRVDASILGGMIVKLGSRMVDSSLKTKLNGIKHAMKEVG
jgi:F-type H+-transporting ATPase subunit delta